MKNSEKFSTPTKATSGRPAYSPALYQMQSAIAKLLVSFRCQSKIREGQAVDRIRGATVAVGDDGGRVVVQEWNRDRILLSYEALVALVGRLGAAVWAPPIGRRRTDILLSSWNISDLTAWKPSDADWKPDPT